MKHTPDMQFSNHSSIVLMLPLSEAASDWIKQYLPEDVIRFGNAIAIEPRYVSGIIDGLNEDGLILSFT